MASSGCPGINSGKTHSAAEIAEFLKIRKMQPIIDRTGGNQ
jgi:hypothetical protein